MVHTNTKLIRVDEKVFEEIHALAGKLQMREGRRVSVNEALRQLLLPKNERVLEKTASTSAASSEKSSEKDFLVRVDMNQNFGGKKRFSTGKTSVAANVAASAPTKKAGGVKGKRVRVSSAEADSAVVKLGSSESLKRFSLKHRKFVAE